MHGQALGGTLLNHQGTHSLGFTETETREIDFKRVFVATMFAAIHHATYWKCMVRVSIFLSHPRVTPLYRDPAQPLISSNTLGTIECLRPHGELAKCSEKSRA